MNHVTRRDADIVRVPTIPEPRLAMTRPIVALGIVGAAIANAARGAAFLAAADGGVVNPDRVRDALQREYQKLGRTLGDEELSAVMAGGPAA